jgi:hypothetical protein
MPSQSRQNPPAMAPYNPDYVCDELNSSPLDNSYIQAAMEALGCAQTSEEEKEQVVLYLSLNSTTHHTDELPETMAAAKKAEAAKLGKYSVLPISDPYADGTQTYEHSLGKEGASQITFWHDDPENMEEGEVQIGDEDPIMLGTEAATTPKELAEIQDNWHSTLTSMGMDKEYADKTVSALLKDSKGDPKKLGSGDGAINELLQYTMAMYRAEKGEYEVSSIVLSGHHWSGERDDDSPVLENNADGTPNLNSTSGIGKGIWGEKGDHEYDYESDDGRSTGGDFFSLEDVASLKDAFPQAYSQVDSVQMAACNTYALDMTDDKGKEQTTPEFLQNTFENIKMASYWEGLAPLAKSGASFNGEFMADHAEMMSGNEEAAKDARYTKRGNADNKRALLDDKGVLKEIETAQDDESYTGKSKGLRGKNTAYHKRDDLSSYLYTPGKDDIKPGYDHTQDEDPDDLWDVITDFFYFNMF